MPYGVSQVQTTPLGEPYTSAVDSTSHVSRMLNTERKGGVPVVPRCHFCLDDWFGQCFVLLRLKTILTGLCPGRSLGATLNSPSQDDLGTCLYASKGDLYGLAENFQ